MSMQYVRDTYGVPVRLHQLVRPIYRCGIQTMVVTSCSHLVHVRMVADTGRHRLRFHPLDLEYKTAAGWVTGESAREAP